MSSTESSDSEYEDCYDGEKSIILECLEQQVFELELLQSMFSPKELCFTDCLSPTVLKSIQESVIQGKSKLENLSPEFQIIKTMPNSSVCEMTVQFSPMYPLRRCAHAFLRCKDMNSQQIGFINCQLRKFVSDGIALGAPQVMEMLNWLEENFERYYLQDSTKNCSAKSSDCSEINGPFGRWIIYSHHIYSKFKRKDIISYALENHLTGFSCPGKPGIICIEGSDEECSRFWDILRTWTWKKIAVRHKEVLECEEGKKVDDLRKFPDFKELGNEVRSGAHLDGGAFRQFLVHKQMHADSIFMQLFGINTS